MLVGSVCTLNSKRRGQPALGIMRTALEGPTSAVDINKTGMATMMLNFCLPRPWNALDVNKDKKSSDQRYDNCVACKAPDSAPNGTKL